MLKKKNKSKKQNQKKKNKKTAATVKNLCYSEKPTRFRVLIIPIYMYKKKI